MLQESLYIAIDLGAGSGRVFLAGLPEAEFQLREVRRFHYAATDFAGHLRWDFPGIFEEIKTGLREAGDQARKLGQSPSSIGVDGWGVDYGLIDRGGRVLERPICYRDGRTQGIMDQAFDLVQREEIFARTGIQFMAFNTLFQLYAHARAGLPATAARLLLIPDLITFLFTGRAITEYTNATTTQMVNAATKSWDREMLERLDLPLGLLTEIVPAGKELGPLKPKLAEELALPGVRVVAPATHDTASAVIGAPLQDGWAYISSGTWSLVGIERNEVLTNSEVARHNFTNEGGAFGTIRFLKNVTGLWILESCRREWKASGLDIDYDELLREVSLAHESVGLIYPDDVRFFNPPSMLQAVAEQLAESNLQVSIDPPVIARIILDSLALRYGSILRTIESLTGKKIKGVQIVGGGSQNDYLNQVTATAVGLPVLAGPVEATATGNVLVQAIAGGRFASLAEARRHVAHNVRLKEFNPRPTPLWEEAKRRYTKIEARFVN